MHAKYKSEEKEHFSKRTCCCLVFYLIRMYLYLKLKNQKKKIQFNDIKNNSTDI